MVTRLENIGIIYKKNKKSKSIIFSYRLSSKFKFSTFHVEKRVKIGLTCCILLYTMIISINKTPPPEGIWQKQMKYKIVDHHTGERKSYDGEQTGLYNSKAEARKADVEYQKRMVGDSLLFNNLTVITKETN